MNSDYRLLDEALQTLLNVRTWVSADYYRNNIADVVVKLKERLAAMSANEFMDSRRSRYFQTVDYDPKQEELFPGKTKSIEEKIRLINQYEPDTTPNHLLEKISNTTLETHEPDTVPNKLVEATTNFGLFNNIKGDYCKSHPDAPHRYLKELSESMGRYVCECEFWSPNI